MNESTDALVQLRDIQLPPALSAWWPLAPGWYVLALLAILIVSGIGVFLYRTINKRRRQQQWQAYLQTIKNNYQHTQDATRTLRELSILIRRIMLIHYPRQQIAALHGQAWLEFLDHTVSCQQFSQGVGKILLQGPYQADCSTDLSEFFNFLNSWLKKMYV